MTAACSESGTTTVSAEPRVWLGCLGCYNAGHLVGEWFDAQDCPMGGQKLAQAGVRVPLVHSAEWHDELWVMDHDGFCGVLVGECSPEEARRVAQLVIDADERGLPVEALAYWVNDGHDTDDARALLDELADAYCGHFHSGPDYAQQLAEDIGAIPDALSWPLTCVDWSVAWRELELGGDNYATRSADGGVLIFRAV